MINKNILLLILLFFTFFKSVDTLAFDIGVVDATAMDSVDCTGDLSNLSIVVENFGTQQVDSFYVYINVNGTLVDSTSIVQSITAGQQLNISLGNYSVFSLPENMISLSTGLPNATLDVQTSNDQYVLYTYSRLSGIYTIGCSTCDFSTVNDAFDHLNDYGVCGPTTFNIEDGIYNTSQLNLSSYVGMSAANPVVFQSTSQDSSAVTLEIYSSPSLVFNAVSNITFRKIKVDPYAGSIGIQLKNVSNFTIENCWIRDAELQTGYAGTGPSFHDVRILNNNFTDGSLLKLGGNSSATLNTNGLVEVVNNRFHNSKMRFILMKDLLIEGNYIDYPTDNHTLDVMTCLNSIITKNNIESSSDLSLYMVGCSNIEVTNNFLRGDGNVIYISNSDTINIVNNSMYQYDADNDIGEAFHFQSSSKIDFINNMVLSQEYGNLFFLSDTSMINPHHNMYYSPSDSLVKYNWSEIYVNYQDWTGSYQKDSSSWNLNPNYISPIDLHIYNHVIANGSAYSYPGIIEDFDGEPRNPLEFDIGADEIDLDYTTLRDIAFISTAEPSNSSCLQADSIQLLVANYSTFQIDSFALVIHSFGTQSSVIWNYTSLPAGDTVLVNMGKYNFSPNTRYDLTMTLALPNGEFDNYTLNNEGSVVYQYLGEPNIQVSTITDCISDVELSVPHQEYSTLNWSTGATSSIITVSPPGVWTVSLTDLNGCVVNKSITLN
ncbi:Right handed beta helix region [Lishizhenia tianjinensis]|uniref:Right handed beta helix region n=1 Tax=Lishizhenia tianjinensis TaxID=477690 RepID=A0A1I6Y3I5_9FLAO|nr:right-handed parallel beta-helix repeat-containing protein [Lishizhenia tianjinensis]SFT45139.1 Right handed beta helix region [Lishizhenia tianjinensis]